MSRLITNCVALFLASTMSFGARADTDPPIIQSSQAAVSYVFEQGMIPDRDTTRLVEFFDRDVKGDRTWTMTFFSDQEFLTAKFDETAEIRLLKQGKRSSIYNSKFHNRQPKMQDDIGSDVRIETARAALLKAFPDATIEDDYIVQFRFCFPSKEGKSSKYENGCRRKEPLNRWKVWLKMQPAKGDWVAKEVFFADDVPPVIKPGPRGYFD